MLATLTSIVLSRFTYSCNPTIYTNLYYWLNHLNIKPSCGKIRKTNAKRYHIRSISLPSRSHPANLRVEEELNKLKIWEASSTSTSGSICIGLSGLEDLYKGMNDLLNMSSTQEILSQYENEKCLNSLLDGSVKLLDIRGITRDLMLQFKEQVQALQSILRRRKGDSNIESSISKYTCFRKKIKKGAKKFIAVLKQMDGKLKAAPFQDDHLIQLFKEVIAMNSSIFQSLFLYLSTSMLKGSMWSAVSKLMHKAAIACEEKQEIALEVSIEDIENCLESVFGHLMKTRACILNIISQ
ncbi:hypothetical protein P3X46_034516 [Hevea brasiliensis]|uniref:Uncharacterized protein n=1 Tax=Hevea brasiliensis TaxID=3981 RepID=A0ABQ9K9D4_HEVBR|nr:hypothetical protein P3X46_034516 [Hevea brasiliensis]